MQTNPLDHLPKIDFVPKDIGNLLDEMIGDYEAEFEKQTGETLSLPPSSRERIFLNTQALRLYQAYNFIDRAAKMNLLKYSEGAYLDNLATMQGIPRRAATAAICQMEFTLSAPREESIFITNGTRISPDGKVFFATSEDVQITPGDTVGVVTAVCTQPGEAGNGFVPGGVNILVDPVAYVGGVKNLDTSQGGSNLESDESVRIRAYFAPMSRSTAGPIEAYQFWVREYSQAIEGVGVFSPVPGEVDIRVVLAGGELPTATYLKEIFDFIEPRRPLTDKLTIQAPDVSDFDLDFTYYIQKSDRDREAEIKAAVEKAAEEFLRWQEGTIGRDLNPDKLISFVIGAGAKRLDVRSPKKQVIAETGIFRHKKTLTNYGGLEAD